MRKFRLYFETTVFNYYFDEKREGHEDVVKLFEAVRDGEFEGYTSEYVVREIEKAPEPKRTNMKNLIEEHKITYLSSNHEVERLAELYIANNVIPPSKLFDCLHVSLASVYELDYVVSYNFHHINRNKTKILATVINNQEGYGGINISTAKEVLENDRNYLQ